MRLRGEPKRCMDPRVKPGGDGRLLLAGEISMLVPSTEPTVASVFAPRASIDPDGTVEGYASLFGEIARRRTAGNMS
jgi:hypothetical protein